MAKIIQENTAHTEPVHEPTDNTQHENENEQPCEHRYNTPDKEIEAIIRLDADWRHYHSVKRIVESREAWSISQTEGWLADGEDPDYPVLHIWPAWEYAAIWLDSKPDLVDMGYAIQCLSLSKLMLNVLPMLDTKQMYLGSFYLPDDPGIIISTTQWKARVDGLIQEWYG
jgi:hypothetical protein